MGKVIFCNPNHSIGSYAVKQFEHRHNMKLSAEYRNFLMQFNGGRPEPESFDFADDSDASMINQFFGIGTGSHDDLERMYRAFSDRIPELFLPIANDPGGNLICIGLDGADRGKIYFWDRNEEADGTIPDMSNMYLLAESFPAFLDGLYAVDDND